MSDERLATLAAEARLSEAAISVTALGAAGWQAAQGARRDVYPASMIKVPIAMALASLCRAGRYRLDQPVDVDPSNMTANDAPSPFRPGTKAALGDLAREMLSKSDNVATNVLIDVLGRDTITAECRALGLTDTAVRRKLSGALPLIDDPAATGRNAHPAADAASAFGRLARDADAAYGFVRAALAEQFWNDKLSRGWRADDAFAHKTGDTDDVSHDGGILTTAGGARYVVVVYTALPAQPETAARFEAFARALRPCLR